MYTVRLVARVLSKSVSRALRFIPFNARCESRRALACEALEKATVDYERNALEVWKLYSGGEDGSEGATLGYFDVGTSEKWLEIARIRWLPVFAEGSTVLAQLFRIVPIVSHFVPILFEQ